MGKDDKQRMEEWADAIQDGANEFLELALELKEADKGYEWPYLLGLYVDRIANFVRKGEFVPELTDKQRTHMAVAFTTTVRGFSSVTEMDSLHDKTVSRIEELSDGFLTLWSSVPGHEEFQQRAPKDVKKPKKVREQLSLPNTGVLPDYDVVVTLPAGTCKEKEERILQKVQELLTHAGGGTCAVVIGKTKATMVKVRVGGSEKYNAVVEEVLRGHIPVNKKTPTPETPPTETSTQA